MEIAVFTSERCTQTLGRYRCHSEAKDEDEEEYGDGSENNMDATPYLSSRAEVATWQEGDGEGEENCYASKSGWIFGLLFQVG